MGCVGVSFLIPDTATIEMLRRTYYLTPPVQFTAQSLICCVYRPSPPRLPSKEMSGLGEACEERRTGTAASQELLQFTAQSLICCVYRPSPPRLPSKEMSGLGEACEERRTGTAASQELLQFTAQSLICCVYRPSPPRLPSKEMSGLGEACEERRTGTAASQELLQFTAQSLICCVYRPSPPRLPSKEMSGLGEACEERRTGTAASQELLQFTAQSLICCVYRPSPPRLPSKEMSEVVSSTMLRSQCLGRVVNSVTCVVYRCDAYHAAVLPEGAKAFINEVVSSTMLRSQCLGRVVNSVTCVVYRCDAYHAAVLPEGAKAFINGKWVDAESKKTFEVRNPFSGDVLYHAANCDVADAKKSVKAARNAYEHWSMELTGKQRGAILQKWYQLMCEKESQLAELLTLEQGKPLTEARGEIQYSSSFLDWYSGEARRIYGQVVPATATNRTHLHTREPIGVVALITPWNFPTAMIARKTGAALAVGCTLVVKPAEDTPLSALAFAEMGMRAGLPEGVFNVIPADRIKTAQISRYLCSSTDVDAISFTGSTAVGKLLLAQSADTVKRVCLELGGNAPLIVFPSANVDVAVKGTMATKFRGSGQTCISANRIFIHSTIHDEYVNKLQKAMKTLVIGDGMKAGVNQGPLINERAVKKVFSVSMALEVTTGAVIGAIIVVIVVQCSPLPDMGSNARRSHKVMWALGSWDPVFDILAPCYIFTTDPAQMARVSRRLQVGMVGVNETMISCAEAAFGGVKESGLGREGAGQGIDEFSQWKYICTGY
ncbi:Succinate-semialdehyde dehydrogenase, mitochondrial [Toxocara canis]|uniref:Succinate-semialdehyde dehydrogenase, mitochondrial n=1 Tax=Toxocara canis TaxID=6265 RepID=A0A0B2UT14_TOXCA|nr:Succinate-semialdehyde dehydrogenase, mitochondrial [Toxocara canis]